MAEVAGLALSAVGVLALAGTFKDCVDLMSLISASRSLGRDFELLDTKLDVEKTLLLQWAERVQLLDPDNYDRRLDRSAVGSAVSRILTSIHLLLSESDNLQHRYGMHKAEETDSIDVRPIVSGNRMTRLNRKFGELSLRIKDKQRQAPFMSKVRWVVHDKEKFDKLISELSYFISRLNRILPDHTGCIPSMTLDDFAPSYGLRILKMVLEASTGLEDIVATTAHKSITKLCEEAILRVLWFRTIDDRRDYIKDPHFRTLEWALSPPRNDIEWSSMADWFQHGSGVYWISGKAGSGKSTLMKHLWKHRKTRVLLQDWASDGSLILASFFFWHLGATEQKTLDGLLRGLLYHIVTSDPSLIPILLPKMWHEARSSTGRPQPPTPTELQEVFRSLANMNDPTRYFCIFIDGLDEHVGNSLDGISFINSLVVNPNIKVLVSSRPIPSCVHAFASKPFLQLQDLTRKDIEAYVNHELESNTYMDLLRDMDPSGAKVILDTLVTKSSGVFLWVTLACRSVLEGLAAFDTVLELQNRVDGLPPELEDLFRHMLQKIDRRYREQAARFLRIRYEYQKRQVAGDVRMPTAGLAIANGYDMDIHRIPKYQIPTRAELKTNCQLLQGRIRSRCCGMLEIVLGEANVNQCFCDAKSHGGHDRLIDSSVEFIHRSVFEFLSGSGSWDISSLKLASSENEASAMLACIFLHLAQLSRWNDPVADRSWTYAADWAVENSLACVKAIETSLSGSLSNYMLNLEAFLLGTWSYLPVTIYHPQGPVTIGTTSFERAMLLAMEAGLVNFLSAQFNSGAWTLTSAHKRCVVSHPMMRPILGRRGLHLKDTSSLKTIQLLVSQGCDPNDKPLYRFVHPRVGRNAHDTVLSKSIWLHVLSYLHELGSASAIIDFAKVFIEAGACIDSVTSTLGSTLESLLLSKAEQFADFIEPDIKKRMNRLDQLIQEKRAATNGDSAESLEMVDGGSNPGGDAQKKRRSSQEPEPTIRPSKKQKAKG